MELAPALLRIGAGFTSPRATGHQSGCTDG